MQTKLVRMADPQPPATGFADEAISHLDALYRGALRLSRDPDRAQDLVQDTYARAFASLHRFLGRSSARTWLLSIARRVCADAVRGAQRARRLPQVSERVGPDVADSVAVRALIAGLDAERREAFVLTQLLGLSYAEAADVCSCPVGTIRSRVARARSDLVDALGGGPARTAQTG